MLQSLCNTTVRLLQLCWQASVNLRAIHQAGTLAFGAGIWNGTLGASRNEVTAIMLLIIKVLRQCWQIGHILGRTRKTNIMIRIIYGSYNGRIILLVAYLYVAEAATLLTAHYTIETLTPPRRGRSS